MNSLTNELGTLVPDRSLMSVIMNMAVLIFPPEQQRKAIGKEISPDQLEPGRPMLEGAEHPLWPIRGMAGCSDFASAGKAIMDRTCSTRSQLSQHKVFYRQAETFRPISILKVAAHCVLQHPTE
jgi:hypothetical protein